MTTRKRHDNDFKARVVLEAIKNQRTIAEIASEHGLCAVQVCKWKKRALDALPGIFSNRCQKTQQGNEALHDELYRQIDQLRVILDCIKKQLGIHD